MKRFHDFEALGLRLAAMTDAGDGDFARPGGRPPGDALALVGMTGRPVATVKQVHGTGVCVVSAGDPCVGHGVEADAIVTQADSVAIAVRVADCVPVFLFDPGRRAIAIVHAGREGTIEGVAGRAVQTMRERFNTVPASVRALIGPGAGPCCYEVDEATAARFAQRGYPTRGRYLDLWEANAMQLRAGGLVTGNVAICGLCTICGNQFHSYRGTRTAARNLAIIAL
jgi:hypothetical protein